MEEWPKNWAGEKADVKIGRAIIEQFKPFVAHLIDKKLSKKTTKTYLSYLAALGGELIRQVNDDSKKRKLSAIDLILKHVNDHGGPYWRHAHNEQDNLKYNSVCKKLFKFMIQKY
jgi:hypothetical protein